MEISDYNVFVYCQSAKIAPQYHKASVAESINSIASEIAVTLREFSFDQLVDITASSVLDAVKQMEWEIDDIEGVSWFLGKYIRAMLKANLITDFDVMFRAVIRKYYKDFC